MTHGQVKLLFYEISFYATIFHPLHTHVSPSINVSIVKAITRSSGHTFWWERTVLHSMESVDSLGKYQFQKKYLLQYTKVPYVT